MFKQIQRSVALALIGAKTFRRYYSELADRSVRLGQGAQSQRRFAEVVLSKEPV